jgi:hypothetical protein
MQFWAFSRLARPTRSHMKINETGASGLISGRAGALCIVKSPAKTFAAFTLHHIRPSLRIPSSSTMRASHEGKTPLKNALSLLGFLTF